MPTRNKIVRTSNVSFDESRFDTTADDEDSDNDGDYVTVDELLYLPTSSGGEHDAEDLSVSPPSSPLPQNVLPQNTSQPPIDVAEDFIDSGIPELGNHRTLSSNADDGDTIVVLPRQQPEPAPRRSGRERHRSDRAQDNIDQGKTSLGQKNRSVNVVKRMHYVFMTSLDGTVDSQPSNLEDIVIPNSYAQAMASPQSDKWIAAMQSEVDSHKTNSTWQLVHLLQVPQDANIIRGRWVFTVKADADGYPVRFKARWVARGFTQRYGVDYEDTYASVTKPATVKVMLALTAMLDLECKQFDLITAFLNALIKKYKIYVEMPHGFEEYHKDGTQLVCLLLRALYGLKQSPLLWYEELTTFLRSIGLEPVQSDPCLFIDRATGAYVLIYVDDLLLIAKTVPIINNVAKILGKKFPLKELGDVSWFLGCRIIRNRKQRKVWIVQDAYIARMSERFGIEHKKRLTPIKSGAELRKAPDGYTARKQLRHRYQALVGSMMWPATITRGDVAYTISKLAMYLTNPTQDHVDAATWCAEYLLYSKTDGICLGGEQSAFQLEGFVDASWADDADSTLR